jgi:dihydrofolate synthase/folylpolyglutamate synthase
VTHSLESQIFEVGPAGGAPLQLELRLLGAHQAENGAVAYVTLETLRQRGWTITPAAVAEGFRTVCWPGRFEIFERRPFVIVDGAHNRDSAQKLRAAVRDYFPGRQAILVFGASRNKEVPGMFAELLSHPATPVVHTILTEAVHPRAWPPDELMSLAQAVAPDAPLTVTTPVARALEKALELSVPEDVIVVCGSLFVVAEALAAQNGREPHAPAHT